MRLKGGILLYTLGISMVVAIICSSFVLWQQLSLQQLNHYKDEVSLYENARSGMCILYSQNSSSQMHKRKIDLYGTGKDNVELSKKNWGLYQLFVSKAISKTSSYQKVELVGCRRPLSTHNLYLADHDRPLSLAGQTILKGELSVPNSGIKRAYIEGQNFTPKNLYSGKLSYSSKQVPALKFEALNKVNVAVQMIAQQSDSLVSWNDMPSQHNQSFSNSCMLFKMNGDAQLGQVKLRNHIQIWVDGHLTIQKSAVLNDVVIKAKSIHVEDGFNGSIQCFAQDSITIGKQVNLTYPSCLVVQNPSAINYASLRIGASSQVIGDILLLAAKNSSSTLIIDKNARIIGQVYTTNQTVHAGSVQGNLSTEKFYLSTLTGTYTNHILNASIVPLTDSNYVYSVLGSTKSSPLNVLKCLN